MKTIKTTKKLQLNKHIVSEMNTTEMNNAKGGLIKTFHLCDMLTVTFYCSVTYNTDCL